MAFEVLIVNGAEPGKTSREILDHAGYVVREVISLEQAADDVLADPPYAVIVESPDAAVAFRFVERLRKHPDTDHVPVLVLGRQADGCGLADFMGTSCIPEPYSARSLLAELAHLTRPRGTWGQPAGARWVGTD